MTKHFLKFFIYSSLFVNLRINCFYFIFLNKLIAESVASTVRHVIVPPGKVIIVHIFVCTRAELAVASARQRNTEPLALEYAAFELLQNIIV